GYIVIRSSSAPEFSSQRLKPSRKSATETSDTFATIAAKSAMVSASNATLTVNKGVVLKLAPAASAAAVFSGLGCSRNIRCFSFHTLI
ncbi:MAG: hypothetical protein ACLP7A_12805, partial [Desulfobaccales bacterium]